MDFINEKKVFYSEDFCCNCGNSISLLRSDSHQCTDLKLCDQCLEERHIIQDDLRMNVRIKFGLGRSPRLRSCFLRLLLSRKVSLEPSGWRTAVALGFELKDASFSLPESIQILLQAGASSIGVGRLLKPIYNEIGLGSLKCEQIRVLDVICDKCLHQYHIRPKECKTEIV